MLVYIGLALVVFILMAGLAIDMGFMYATKTQLQNAADAGALSGALKMKKVGLPHDGSQALARQWAITTAQRNIAAGLNVQLASNGTNTISDANDITVGHWNESTRTYTPGGGAANIFNAMQVRTRRTDTAPAGPVQTFLARIRPEWQTMGVAAQGVAAFPPRASNYVTVCPQACGTCTYDPTNPTFDLNNPDSWPAACQNVVISQPSPDPSGTNSYDKFAWTTLLNDPTSANAMRDLVQGKDPAQNVCGKNIYTTMGTMTDVMRDMESNMYFKGYDGSNKSLHADGTVDTWWIIIPVTDNCPPGQQGGWDPKPVTRYAKIRVQAICVNGAAGYNGSRAEGMECTPPNYDGNIVYDRIMCVDCAYADLLTGTKVNLVK